MNKALGCAVLAFVMLAPAVRADDDNAVDIKVTPITLKMESVHPKEVFEELSKQTGVTVQVWPENLWNQNYGNNGPPTSVTIDIDQKPYWAAMEEICTQTHLYPVNMGNNDALTLQWRGGDATGPFGKKPTFASENGTIVASSIQRSHTINFDQADPQPVRTCGINIEGYVDPRLRIASYSSQPTIEKAEDENGNSILPAQGPQNQSMNQVYTSWQIGNIFIPLDYDPEKSHKLATLKGSIKVIAAGAVERLELGDLGNANGTVKELAGRKMTFEDIKVEDKSFSVKMTIVREGMSNEEWQGIFQNVIRGMKVETSSGRKLNLGGGGGGSDKQVTYTLSTTWSEDDDKAVKLLWDIPTKFQDMEIPFEFKDLTLP